MPLNKIDFHNGCPYQTPHGMFYYVADVENSIQQLKAEIAALIPALVDGYNNMRDDQHGIAINKLRQLSAV